MNEPRGLELIDGCHPSDRCHLSLSKSRRVDNPRRSVCLEVIDKKLLHGYQNYPKTKRRKGDRHLGIDVTAHRPDENVHSLVRLRITSAPSVAP